MRSEPRALFACVAGAVLGLAFIGCSSESRREDTDASPSDDSGTSFDGAGADTGSGCAIPECLRPVNCRLSCSGPIVVSSCCACMPPAFDDLCCRADACAGPL